MIEKSLPWISTRVPFAVATSTGSRVVQLGTVAPASDFSHAACAAVALRRRSSSSALRRRAISASSDLQRRPLALARAGSPGSRRPTGFSFTSAKKAAKL